MLKTIWQDPVEMRTDRALSLNHRTEFLERRSGLMDSCGGGSEEQEECW